MMRDYTGGWKNGEKNVEEEREKRVEEREGSEESVWRIREKGRKEGRYVMNMNF